MRSKLVRHVIQCEFWMSEEDQSGCSVGRAVFFLFPASITYCVQVLDQIRKRVKPILYKVAMSGFLEYESNAPLFEKNNIAVDIMIDVLTDRGFSVSYRRKLHTIPARIELKTGAIHTIRLWWHVFRITFPGGSVRDLKNLHSEASQRCGLPLTPSVYDLRNVLQETVLKQARDAGPLTRRQAF
jgi:hypothetical protein